MVYWIYKDERDEWRWYLKSVDGDKIADSGKSYKDKYDCEHDVNLVKGSANTPVYTLAEEQRFRIGRSVGPFGVSGGQT